MKVLSTKRVPIEQLAPYAANPRNGDIDAIAESIREHGQYRALVVRQQDMVVLAGNHTLHAMLQEGLEKALVHLIECDDDEARRIVLVDNRTNDLAGYDNELLAQTLTGLGGDYAGTGYEQRDLDRLLERIAADEAQTTDGSTEQTGECPNCGHCTTLKSFKSEG